MRVITDSIAESHAYDDAGRLSSVTLGGVVQASYLYDSQGRQAIRTLGSSGVQIQSVFDRAGHRIAEYNGGTGALIRQYVWLEDRPVAVVEGGVTYLVRTDFIGRPAFATTMAGVKVWSASYLPFGGVNTITGAPIDLRFPGQWFQAEAGLYQNWMRDYDPTTGRYIEADPLGLVDGASVYGYVRGNPGRYTDARGEQTYGPDVPFEGLGPLPGADHDVSKEWQDPPHSVPREYETEICAMGVPCGWGIDWRYSGVYQMYCLPGTRPSSRNPNMSYPGGYEVGVVTSFRDGKLTVTHRFFNSGNDCSLCAERQLVGPLWKRPNK